MRRRSLRFLSCLAAMLLSTPAPGAEAVLEKCFECHGADGLGLISYYDWTNDDLKYAHWDGVAWLIQAVDTGGDVGWYNSLALDRSWLYWGDCISLFIFLLIS